MARRCVFCGVEGSLSNEHVIPKWFSRLFDLSPQGRFIHEQESENGNKPSRYRSSSLIDIRTKTACKPCNTGWMSALEKAVIPILGPMVVGYGVTMTRPAMDKLALWAVKTAVMNAMAAPDQRAAVTQPTTDWLFKHRQPPPKSGVWIGRYLGALGGASFAAKVIPRRLDATDIKTGRVFVFYDWTAAFGPVLFKVVLSPPELWGVSYRVSFDEPKPLIPLHADLHLDSCTWPPNLGYLEPELINLSYAMCGMRITLEAPQAA